MGVVPSIEEWARGHGVAVTIPEDYGAAPLTDPRVDYGCSMVRTPRCVVRPRTTDQLSGCLAALRAGELPYKLRGAGYSSGGQVLSEGGVIVDLTGMSGVVADDPARQEVTVLGGTSWLAVGVELRKSGRRPLVLAENLHMTVGGFVSLGGVGDTTTVHGLAIQTVVRLGIVTPDGELRRVGPGDRLFRAALGGGGLFGALADVTLKTVTRAQAVVLRTAIWDALDAFLVDAAMNSDERRSEIFLGGMFFHAGQPVFIGTFGNFGAAPEPDDPALEDLHARIVQPPQIVDRFEGHRQTTFSWGPARPSLQAIVPLPAARDVVDELGRWLPGSPLGALVDRVGLVLFRRADGFPAAPLPDNGSHALAILVRAELPDARVPDPVIAALARIGERAVAAGGRVIASSIAAPRAPLGAELAALRAELDPLGLCNRDLVDLV